MQRVKRYESRGVSSSKEDVHAVVDKIDKGLFPGAFCKITEDFLTGDSGKCNVIHSDGSGTKSVLAYLHYKETGDPSAFRGIAQDSIVMNIDDLLCCGITDRIIISSTINRNAKSIPSDVLRELIEGTESFLRELRGLGLNIISGGGETADVGDLTPTVLVDSCAVAVAKRNTIIDNNNIVPGLAIVGLSSSGKAHYENFENSGIGSNGLTSARHDLLSSYYLDKYPETVDANMLKDLAYCGPHRLNDLLEGSSLTIKEALLSPTRTYFPIISKIIKTHPGLIKGLVHCSGGGQTKCLRFGKKVHYVKDNLLHIPPVFQEIKKCSGSRWEEMFGVFNMGHRMEVFCEQQESKDVIEIAGEFGVQAKVIGYTERIPKGDKNNLSIDYDGKEFQYEAP